MERPYDYGLLFRQFLAGIELQHLAFGANATVYWLFHSN